MVLTTLNQKGQVTIPAKVRKKLGLKPGSQVCLQMSEGEESLIINPTNSIMDAFGVLPKPDRAYSIEEINEGIELAAAEHAMKHVRN